MRAMMEMRPPPALGAAVAEEAPAGLAVQPLTSASGVSALAGLPTTPRGPPSAPPAGGQGLVSGALGLLASGLAAAAGGVAGVAGEAGLLYAPAAAASFRADLLRSGDPGPAVLRGVRLPVLLLCSACDRLLPSIVEGGLRGLGAMSIVEGGLRGLGAMGRRSRSCARRCLACAGAAPRVDPCSAGSSRCQQLCHVHTRTALRCSDGGAVPRCAAGARLERLLPSARRVLLPNSGHAALLERGFSLASTLQSAGFAGPIVALGPVARRVAGKSAPGQRAGGGGAGPSAAGVAGGAAPSAAVSGLGPATTSAAATAEVLAAGSGAAAAAGQHGVGTGPAVQWPGAAGAGSADAAGLPPQLPSAGPAGGAASSSSPDAGEPVDADASFDVWAQNLAPWRVRRGHARCAVCRGHNAPVGLAGGDAQHARHGWAALPCEPAVAVPHGPGRADGDDDTRSICARALKREPRCAPPSGGVPVLSIRNVCPEPPNHPPYTAQQFLCTYPHPRARPNTCMRAHRQSHCAAAACLLSGSKREAPPRAARCWPAAFPKELISPVVLGAEALPPPGSPLFERPVGGVACCGCRAVQTSRTAGPFRAARRA
jgi:hypothetical protein